MPAQRAGLRGSAAPQGKFPFGVGRSPSLIAGGGPRRGGGSGHPRTSWAPAGSAAGPTRPCGAPVGRGGVRELCPGRAGVPTALPLGAQTRQVPATALDACPGDAETAWQPVPFSKCPPCPRGAGPPSPPPSADPGWLGAHAGGTHRGGLRAHGLSGAPGPRRARRAPGGCGRPAGRGGSGSR